MDSCWFDGHDLSDFLVDVGEGGGEHRQCDNDLLSWGEFGIITPTDPETPGLF